MASLSTTYLGLQLKNPLIVAASGLTSTVDGVRKAVDAGAGAVVLKSLFEEQLRAELATYADAGEGMHPEAAAFMEAMGVHGGAGEYLDLIKNAKKIAGSVPIIASVNCLEGDLWVDFTEQIELSGADALELNVAPFPDSVAAPSRELEDAVVAVVRNVSVRTKLPIAVKIGPYYTNPLGLVDRLAGAGANATVLFNRFYKFDFDLGAMALKAGPQFSGPGDYHESLRWIANLYGAVGCELVGGTGIHDAETALKFIAGGATAVQVCSALYQGGWSVLAAMRDQMSTRLDSLKIASTDALRGKLARRSGAQGERYERLQYIKALTGIA